MFGLLRLYYIMRVLEGRDEDDDEFWSDFVVRLAAYGVYREKDECSKKVISAFMSVMS